MTLGNERTPDEPKGSLTVVKTDAVSGDPLPGAVFEAWEETNGRAGLQTSGDDPDRRTGPGCATDARGRCAFGELELGEYYLRETAVPDGYRLPDRTVTGPYRLTSGNASDGITVTLKNDRDKDGNGGKGGKGSKGGKGGK
ncbi:SpaA isopeptide-forming pilin-related protein [Streptomyces boncukensis]|uniref:SpaA-like prealbumin fold domain-containing protein n=1 Tax=Streptomyces boncukensis TaxID=2711219 RepID=A0A6G4X7K0_9ACTN|nr:hypothetical protein [Streptomyces boncukensis]